MRWQIITTIIIIVTVTASLIGWDIYVATNNIPDRLDTISGRIRIWAISTPVIPWIWCILAGHFFRPLVFIGLVKPITGVILLAFITWSLMVTGLALRSKGIVIPPWTICLPAFLAGAILWSQ